MPTFLKDVTKSAGLLSSSPHIKANANDIRPLRIPTHPNFQGSNNKKKSRQLWRCIRCHSTVNEKRIQRGLMYRRQFLLAFISLPLKPQQMMVSMTPPSSLTYYHNIANAVQEAEKLKKTSNGSPEINGVVCWISSSEPLKTPNIYMSSDDLSGMIALPPAQELVHEINEKDVVTALVRRPAALKLMKNMEEQLVLEGIEVTNDEPLCFDVYIKYGQEEKDDEEELYVGTFSHMPPRSDKGGRHINKQDFDGGQEQKRERRCCLRLGMHGMLSHRLESVIVKLVPIFKLSDDSIKVESIFIEYT